LIIQQFLPIICHLTNQLSLCIHDDDDDDDSIMENVDLRWPLLCLQVFGQRSSGHFLLQQRQTENCLRDSGHIVLWQTETGRNRNRPSCGRERLSGSLPPSRRQLLFLCMRVCVCTRACVYVCVRVCI